MEDLEEPKQKDRSRKKQLYASIRNQMEFYFSPSHLAKKNLTADLLQKNGSIELTTFLSYNKIRALTNNIDDMAKALKHSLLLEVTEDMKVKPKILQKKDNIDQCTIYIEQVPPEADHEWLREQFTIYGPVDYVSVPKYFGSKKCKGFAFVEFSSPEFAEKAVEEYKKAGTYLSTSEMDPKCLLSIATFEGKSENGVSKENNDSTSSDIHGKRKVEINPDVDESEVQNKNLKPNPEPVQGKDVKFQAVNEGEENTEEMKKKKNRNKKKKTKKTKITAESSGFQILSKKDWKLLRNKYLTMQKEKTKMLKHHLKHLKQKQHKHRADKNGQEEISNNTPKETSNSTIPSEFTPGLIVKISVNEPVVNKKEFKKEIGVVSSAIKYTDIKEGTTTIHVRLKTNEDAKQFCENSPWLEVEIITGEEELEYWKKMEKDREEKLSKPKIKQRGKEKLFKKAEKVLGQRITFD